MKKKIKLESKKKLGRTTKYTEALGDVICSRISQGESLNKICKEKDMPSAVSVFAWLRLYEDFLNNYTRAREEQAETYADEIAEIADNAKNDWMERNGQDSVGWQLNGEHVQRSRLRIESRKWLAMKLKPKKYGDSLALKAEVKDTTGALGWLEDTLGKIDKNKK